MSDSFFSAKTHFDRQIDNPTMDVLACAMLVEAAARRIARLGGPIEAATHLQRVSDICAGAYVLPVEHWQKLGAASAPPPPSVSEEARPRSRWWWLKLVTVDNRGFFFVAGLWLGALWESLWR